MSQESVALVYRGAEAFNRRDLDAFLALNDADVEFTSRFAELEGGGPYRGHDGIRSWSENVCGIWSDVSVEIGEARDLGDVTVNAAALSRPWHRERRALGADAMAARGVAALFGGHLRKLVVSLPLRAKNSSCEATSYPNGLSGTVIEPSSTA
jgi:SnoaL-like protein